MSLIWSFTFRVASSKAEIPDWAIRKTTVRAKSPFIFRLPLERMTDRLGTSHAESKMIAERSHLCQDCKNKQEGPNQDQKDGHHPEILAFFIDHGQGKDQTQDQ